jgi:hypothetical protein
LDSLDLTRSHSVSLDPTQTHLIHFARTAKGNSPTAQPTAPYSPAHSRPTAPYSQPLAAPAPPPPAAACPAAASAGAPPQPQLHGAFAVLWLPAEPGREGTRAAAVHGLPLGRSGTACAAALSIAQSGPARRAHVRANLLRSARRRRLLQQSRRRLRWLHTWALVGACCWWAVSTATSLQHSRLPAISCIAA